MRKKKFNKDLYFKIIPIFFLGFSLGIITIWPSIIFENNRRCFFTIIKDGIDGDIKLKTIFTINPNYALRIKNTNNKYLKILMVGDSCFR